MAFSCKLRHEEKLNNNALLEEHHHYLKERKGKHQKIFIKNDKNVLSHPRNPNEH